MNVDKSVFKTDRMIYMGHIISSRGVEPDPAKVQGITKMPAPMNKAQILTFQGTVNDLAKFLPYLSEVRKPIKLREDVEFMWGKSQEEAFKKVKQLVTTAPVLAFYDCDAEMILQCDASNKDLGAALMRSVKPIAFGSRVLTETEQ